MSTQKSLDILTNVLQNIKKVEVLSVLNNITEKFEDGKETKTEPSETKTEPSETKLETPETKTTIGSIMTQATESKTATETKQTEDSETKNKDTQYDTEYLIKWAFIGFGVFAGVLILFSIIYYMFFSSSSTPVNSQDMNLEYSQYYPDENNYDTHFKQSSSYNSQNIPSMKKSSVLNNSQSYNKSLNNSQSYNKSLNNSQNYNKSLNNSQNYNKTDQSISNSKNLTNKDLSADSPDYYNEEMSQKPYQQNEPDSSFLDMFNSKKTENPTMNKIVGGKKR